MRRLRRRRDGRRSARKMSPAVVAGSSYLPSELPVNDNPWCTALPCLSHVYQLSLRRVSLFLSLSRSVSRGAHHLRCTSPTEFSVFVRTRDSEGFRARAVAETERLRRRVLPRERDSTRIRLNSYHCLSSCVCV